MIPEIDAYRYSKLAAAAEIKDTYTPDKATVMSSLLAQLGEVRDITGDEGDVVIVMSRPVYDKLMLPGRSPTLWNLLSSSRANLSSPLSLSTAFL